MTSQNPAPLLGARYRRAIIASLCITALLYLAVVVFVGADQIFTILRRLSIEGWLFLLALSLCSYLLRFVRWQCYLRLAGWKLPVRLHLAYYFAGFALTTTPGKAGETIRSVLLRPHGVAYPTSLACFFTERLLDVVVVALLAALAMLGLQQNTSFVLVVFAVALAVIPLLRSRFFPLLLEQLSRRVSSVRLTRLFDGLLRSLHDARSLLCPRPLCLGLLIGMLAWSLQGMAFYFLMRSVGMDLAMPLAVGIYSVGLLAGALSMIPGGIGATELATGLLLAAAGADAHVAMAAPLISRLSTLWFAVALGLLASIWLGSQAHPAGLK